MSKLKLSKGIVSCISQCYNNM